MKPKIIEVSERSSQEKMSAPNARTVPAATRIAASAANEPRTSAGIARSSRQGTALDQAKAAMLGPQAAAKATRYQPSAGWPGSSASVNR